MANKYSGTVFEIDTTTDGDGLATLKGGAPDKGDTFYIYNGAEVTISGDINFKKMVLGVDMAGASSTGELVFLGGGGWGSATGSGNGLYVDALGHITTWGGELTKASGETGTWEIAQLDGILDLQYCHISNCDIVAAIAGNVNFYSANVDLDFTLTNELIISGTMTLMSSSIDSANGTRWGLLNYGFFSMDVWSVMTFAKLAIVCSSQALIFDDDPDVMQEDDSPDIAIGIPLGGNKSRGKRLAMSGKRLNIRGTFNISRLESHWLKLKYMFKLYDTFAVTWDEGGMNKALITKMPILRDPTQIQEREYNIELREIY